MLKHTPLVRLGEPNDIAHAALYLFAGGKLGQRAGAYSQWWQRTG